MTLYKYQQRAVDFILEKKRVALFLDMGIGKTIISLTSACELLKTGKIKKCLVIAPLAVAKNTWDTEIKKWPHLKHLKYKVCVGNEKERIEAFSSDADIYIINRENIPWCLAKGFNAFGMIIVDESSSFKSHSSQRFKALACFKYLYMVLLSGTPSPNGLHDLWSQLFLLDHGERLEKKISRFRDKYCTTERYGFNYKVISPEEISDKISDICMSLKAADYLELPKLININTIVSLPNFSQYSYFKKNYVLEDITAINAAVLTSKLLQYCNGAVYDEEKDYLEVHNEKIEALQNIIDENPNDNILVAYNYRSDVERLKKKFKDAVVFNSKTDCVTQWNQGNIKIMLCHPASAGKGLNLQEGGNIIVWFGLTWNLEDYLQFNARLHRQGQLKPVVINHIIVKNTIDELVLAKLFGKQLTQNDLLEVLKLELNKK